MPPYSTLLIFSACLTVLALIILKKSAPMPRGRFFVAPLFFILLVGFGIFTAINNFTGQGIDERVIYHLKVGLDGAGFGDFATSIVGGGIYIVAAFVLALILFDGLGSKKLKLTRLVESRIPSLPIPTSDTGKARWGVSLLGLAFLTHPLSNNFFHLRNSFNLPAASLQERNFYEPAKPLTVNNDKNIILIYLEGTEGTFLDQNIFPGLAPNMLELEQNNLSFRAIDQVYSTGYTMGGLVGSQCGIPIFVPTSDKNAMEKYDAFLENLTCLGDILKSNGYVLHFIGGANPRFGGKGKFLKTHGFDVVLGHMELFNRGRIIREGFGGWGMPDDMLFDQALVQLDKLAEGEDPFVLAALTVDTHPPDGHVSKSCKDVQYQDLNDSRLNAVYCNDGLLAEFLDTMRTKPYWHDSIIVIMSDHFMMETPVTPMLEKSERRNYFVILDPSKDENDVIRRPGSILDIAPTLLSYLGADVQSFGFGRNLLSEDTSTLFETFGDETDNVLRKNEPILQKVIWSYPDFGPQLRLAKKGRELILADDRRVELPVTFVVDDQLKIIDMDFPIPYKKRQAGYLYKRLPIDQDYIWIDKCENMSKLPAEIPETSDEKSRCLAFQNLEGESLDIFPMPYENPFAMSQLK